MILMNNTVEQQTHRRETEPVLTVDGVRKEFGGVTALDGATLEVRDGEIVGVVGPNGAGKSTLFNCIMGVHDLTDGRVGLNGTDISSQRTDVIVNSGVSRTFQLARVFPDLTVRENMLINQEHDESMLKTLITGSDDAVVDRADELLEFVGLLSLAESPAGELSTGQKKLLSIAGALLSDPDVVLLDEPAAGVNPGLVDDIAQTIVALNERGATFCIIEHDMDMIRSLSEYLYVLHNGTNLREGEPDTVLKDDAVLEAYFGQ